MKASRILFCIIFLLIASLFSTNVFGKSGEVNLGDKTPSDKKEKLIWNVNRQITGFRVEIKAGKPIINEIKLLDTDNEWTVGAYFDTGQKWEKKFSSPIQAGQLRVNVDKASGSKLRLIVYTSGSSATTTTTSSAVSSKSGTIDLGSKTPSDNKEKLVWNVNRTITGYKVEIKSGNLIINEVRFLGGQKWTVGRYFNAGEKFEQSLASPTSVGQLRVNVDKARGDKINLVVYTGSSRTASDNEDDDEGISIEGLNKNAEEKLDKVFKGFEF